jgi:glutamate-ammonia-ligase adenylyltransferase
LTAAYLLFWRLQLVAKLLSDRPLDPAGIGEGGCRMLMRETGFETLDALEAALIEVAAEADAAIHAALGTDTGEAA